MIKLKKMHVLTAENPYNLNTYRIIKIFFVLHNTYIVLNNQNKVNFYINNYIDRDQFN